MQLAFMLNKFVKQLVFPARSLLFDYRQQGDAIWSVFSAGREGTLWFYDSLINLYRQTHSTLMLEELARVINELEQISKSEVNL